MDMKSVCTSIDIPPPQQELRALGYFEKHDNNWIINTRTGTGKTQVIALEKIRAVLGQGFRAVYIAPTRALADEVFLRFSEQLGGSRTGIFTGDYTEDNPPPLSIESAMCSIMTAERFDLFVRHYHDHSHWLAKTRVVILDEIHLLGAGGQRAARLDGLIGRWRRINPFCRLVALSGTLGFPRHLAVWLGGRHYESDWQPAPLTWLVEPVQDAKDKLHKIIRLSTSSPETAGKTLIFVASRRKAEQYAEALSDSGIRAAYHHAGLAHTKRTEIESNFRTGTVPVLCATTTLAVGVNLGEISRVIIADLSMPSGKVVCGKPRYEPFRVADIHQLAGRCGRYGASGGTVILLPFAWDSKFDIDGILNREIEPISSALCEDSYLAEQIVTEISMGLSSRVNHVVSAFSTTYGHHNDDISEGAIKRCISAMTKAGMIDRKPGRGLKATRIGDVACHYLMPPDTVVYLRDALWSDAATAPSAVDIAFHVLNSGDFAALPAVDYEALPDFARVLDGIRSHLLHPAKLDQLALSPGQILSILGVLASGCSGGADLFDAWQLREIRMEFNRLLRGTSAILREVTRDVDECSITCLRRRFLLTRARYVYGITDDGVAQFTFIDGIGGVLAERLSKAGFTDLQSIAQAEPSALARIDGIRFIGAHKLVAQATTLLPLLAGDDDNMPPKVSVIAQTGIDAESEYRIARSTELQAACIGHHQWRVTGGMEPHYVELQRRAFACDCGDFAWRQADCKHIFAVRMQLSDPQVKRLATTSESDSETINLVTLWKQHQCAR